MKDRIVHNPGELVDNEFTAYEYRLPLSEIPPEADEQWTDWLAAYVNRNKDGVGELIQSRFLGASDDLAPLYKLVMDYVPFAILVFGGTPLLWLEKTQGGKRDFIYLPPESNNQEVRNALKPFQLDSHRLLVEFLALFGGMGERCPWEEIGFFGNRHRGKTVIVPATVAIEAGFEYQTEIEIREQRQCFTRWIGGIQLLNGGDGLYWHIGPDGSVCEHRCGEPGVYGFIDTLSETIASFVKASKDDCLFDGGYDGLPDMKILE